MNVSRLMDSYLQYKNMMLSHNSYRAYSNVIRKMDSRIQDIGDLDRSIANDIINETGAVKTRLLRKAVIDNFVGWAIKEGVMTHAIPTEVFATKAEKEQKIIAISEYQFQVLMSGVDDGRVRDVMRVGFYMGLRINEMVHCRPAWIIDGRFLRVGDLREWGLEDEFHPKSQKEHDLPIAIPVQVRQIFTRVSQTDPHRPMFGFGSDSSLRANLKEYFKALPGNLSETFTAHHLRHSCISFWINEKRVHIQQVQRLARHERLSTTLRYYHPDDNAHWKSFN